MTDIPSMVVEGTRKQTATSRDGPPGMGRAIEARKLGLQRRRAKGLDDVPGEPNKTERRKKAKKKKKGP